MITELELLIAKEITKDLTKKWSINELAKATDKQYAPIHAAVQRLIQQNILQKNANELIEPTLTHTTLLEYAEKQREIKNKDVQAIQKKLQETNGFFSAVLFGSSTTSKGNDIDILIIVSNETNTETVTKNIHKALGSFAELTDTQIIQEKSCYEMLNNPNQLNVMNEILKNHLVLKGYEEFYNILKRWKNAR